MRDPDYQGLRYQEVLLLKLRNDLGREALALDLRIGAEVGTLYVTLVER